jgi:WhiB family redox-sensing transcriptional regulator
MTWAGCRDTDADVFYPVEGGSAEPAKRICSRCPVESECLEWALSQGEDMGVWGGMSERERARLKKASRRR